MSRKSVDISQGNRRYQRLGGTIGGDGYTDRQFEKPVTKAPIKAISLAAGLFIAGSALIVVAVLLLTGHIDAKYADRTWPMLILGAIMFIPGIYHVRIAYYAYKGYEGFSYEMIPDFE